MCYVLESFSVWRIVTEWNVEKVRRRKFHYKEWDDRNYGGSVSETAKVSVLNQFLKFYHMFIISVC